MKRAIFFIILGVVFTAGCVQTQQIYSWGTYSTTLYNYKKAPTDENLVAHKQNLLNIIQESENQDKRVPPGVCCEYGYLLYKDGNADEGTKFMKMEVQMYPESKVFIQHLLKPSGKEKEKEL